MLVILVITLAGGIYWAVSQPKDEEPDGKVHIQPPVDDGGSPGS